MTFRDQDDDTSTGRMTQGGSKARTGKSIWWLLAALVIIGAVAVAVTTLPRKQAPAEAGTSPVSGASATPTAPSTGGGGGARQP